MRIFDKDRVLAKSTFLHGKKVESAGSAVFKIKSAENGTANRTKTECETESEKNDALEHEPG